MAKAGALQGDGWRFARLFVLAVILFGGGAGAFHLSTQLQQRTDGMTRYVRVDVWAVQQVEYEVQQFRTAFARHVAGEADVTLGTVRARLAGARATVPLLRRGPDYQDFRLLVDIDSAADSALETLNRLEQILAGAETFRGDLAILQIVEDSLADPVDSLRQLAVDLAHVRAALQDGDLANVIWLTDVNRWLVTVFFCVVVVFIGFLLSETRRAKQAETRATLARNSLQAAIESISEGFALHDAQDRLVLSNSKLRTLLGDAGGSLALGQSFEEAIRGIAATGQIKDAEGREEQWIAERLELHRNPDTPFELALTNGIHLMISERRTLDGGVVGIYTDITELKNRQDSLEAARQEAESMSRAKSEFLANMSHELRTPLNSIIGFSEIIAGESLGPSGVPEYKDYAGEIAGSGKQLLGVLNDILDMSRIEAGAFSVNAEQVDLGEVIRSCTRLAREDAEAVGHELTVALPETPQIAVADERLLKRSLTNLLDNAIKFTPDGGGITVELTRDEADNVEIVVADTGIGIAEEDIPKALAFFGQADGRLARSYEGTGLGLPLAKNLIELQGGRLRLDSVVDQGTRITITFPAEREAALPSHETNQRLAG